MPSCGSPTSDKPDTDSPKHTNASSHLLTIDWLRKTSLDLDAVESREQQADR